MKKLFLSLGTVMFCALSILAQTPYDNFAPEQSVKSMIEMPQMQFKVANTDPNSKIRYVEFDKSTLSVHLLNEDSDIIKTIALNSSDKKFTTMDPLAEKYYSISPYAYCANNPLKFIDPTGMDIRLTGEEAQAAFRELQLAASKGLTLNMHGDNVLYTLNEDYTLTDADKDIISIINDNSIIVNMEAGHAPYSPLGGLFVIGQFGGNTINKDENGNIVSVNALQIIDPHQMNELDTNFGTPGGNMMHELYEAYTAGTYAKKYGMKGEPTSGGTNAIYTTAHNETSRKYPNSPFSVWFQDSNGNTVSSMQQATSVKWFYMNKSNQKVIFQHITR